MIKLINVSNIKVDNYPLNPSTLALVDHLRADGSVPPIRVKRGDNGVYLIKDGRHRVTAYKLLGRKQILAKISIENEKCKR